MSAKALIESERPTGGMKLAGLKDRDAQRILVNVAVIFGIGAVVQVHNGYFFQSRNLWSLFVQIAVVAIIACAESLVMVAGCIDVSVGGVVVLSGVVAGLLSEHGVPLALAFALAVVVGAGVGLVNAFLILVVEYRA